MNYLNVITCVSVSVVLVSDTDRQVWDTPLIRGVGATKKERLVETRKHNNI